MIFLLCILLVFLLASLCLYLVFPRCTKWKHTNYDVCIVLGSPAKEDGSLSRMQKSRMDRAIQLYQQHNVFCIIITGGAVVNTYCEADIMADYAIKQGIPASVILCEQQAQNTYDNLRFSKILCNQHHFERIVVVTSCFHIRRAAFFTKKFFTDFVMAATLEKESIHHYISEYFRMWNTLRFEWILRHKKG